MKFILEVNNKTKFKVSKKQFLDTFKLTLDDTKIDFFMQKDVQLSIALVDEDEIHELNKQYRKKNRPTDVLSFSEYESLKEMQEEKNKNLFIGELILCPEYIAKNAEEDNETFEYALTYIVSHGILHLLGYPHGKKMFNLQRAVADKLTK